MRAIKRKLKSAAGMLLFRSGLYRLLLRNRAAIVLFHRVDDRLKGNPVACTERAFEEYCDFFRSYFRVVPLPELLRRLEAGEDITGMLAITFDDGYLDNFEIAAPALQARALPACFFVATDFIGSETRPWWDVEYGGVSRWMSWDQVRRLHAAGFDIGAHTRSHVDLGVVRAEQAREEIAGSRHRLEAEVGARCVLFSYPYGRAHQLTEENRRLVGEAGLKCCLSGFGGTVRPGDDPMRLARSPVTPWHVSTGQFAFELLFGA